MVIIYYFVWLSSRLISKLFYGIRVKGTEHFPRKGGFILATNHISYYDPPLVGGWCPRGLYYLAKKELFKPWAGWILRGVHALPVRRGAVDRKTLDTCVEIIQSGSGLLIFPEGTRARKGSFLPAKPGIGMIALRAACPIVPAYIKGSNHLTDCFWRRERMSITYGEPLTASEVASFTVDKQGYLALSETVMERIRILRDSLKPDNRPSDES
jgi:1-acyl-sn-glycerol-3-phosphate acyltransferase